MKAANTAVAPHGIVDVTQEYHRRNAGAPKLWLTLDLQSYELTSRGSSFSFPVGMNEIAWIIA